MSRYAFIFGVLILGISVQGCLPAPYFQKEVTVPQYNWTSTFQPSFSVNISDTVANYRPFFIIRHTQEYPYSNIWILLHIKAPGEKTDVPVRVNVPLAEASGKWQGRGMGEIYEQRLMVTLPDSLSFKKSGTYIITLEQNMRLNPLPEVMNVGFRLEKLPYGAR